MDLENSGWTNSGTACTYSPSQNLVWHPKPLFGEVASAHQKQRRLEGNQSHNFEVPLRKRRIRGHGGKEAKLLSFLPGFFLGVRSGSEDSAALH